MIKFVFSPDVKRSAKIRISVISIKIFEKMFNNESQLLSTEW